ncbi:MAG: 50S ribosomal protein L18 [Candidatus Micrarchaeia archaeon]
MIRKRRRLSLTNYKKRIALLKSGLPRLVIRKSNRSVVLQIAEYDQKGDKILASANSHMLEKYDWEPRANRPTAYLTGLLLAKKCKDLKLGDVILDLGLYKPIKNSLIFAAAKGAQDGGIKLKGSIEVDEKLINGEYIEKYAKSLDDNKFKKQFGYNKIDPKNITDAFAHTKEKLMVVN